MEGECGEVGFVHAGSIYTYTSATDSMVRRLKLVSGLRD